MRILPYCLAAVLALATPAFAGKAGKPAKAGKKGHHREAPALSARKFDKNHNHQIDGDEIAPFKAAFAAAPADNRLKAHVDTNKNGVLEDSELTVLNTRLAAHAEKGGKKAARGKGKGKTGKKGSRKTTA